ncbi:MAG: helix-turn-helix domain-containing protein [Pseudomonadota bacterium]
MIHSKPRYQISEAAELLGVSRAYLYNRASQGLIKLTKDGARSFVTASEVDRYAAACAASTDAPSAQAAA